MKEICETKSIGRIALKIVDLTSDIVNYKHVKLLMVSHFLG